MLKMSKGVILITPSFLQKLEKGAKQTQSKKKKWNNKEQKNKIGNRKILPKTQGKKKVGASKKKSIKLINL